MRRGATMTITFPCEGCGRRLKVEGARPGAAIACPKCGRRLTIPAAPAPDAAPATGAPLPSFDAPVAPRPAPTPAAAPAFDPFDDLADGPDEEAAPAAPAAATLPPAAFRRGRSASPSRPTAPAAGRSPAVVAAIVAGAVLVVGAAIGLGVLLALKYGGNKEEDEGNPNDTVAQLSADQDMAARDSGASRFANPEQEKLFLDLLGKLEAFPKLLAEVRDKESAERLAPQVKEAFRDLLAASKEASGKIRNSPQASGELTTRHRQRLEASQKAFQDEAKRLQGQAFARPIDVAMSQVFTEFVKQGGFGPNAPGLPVGSLSGYPGPAVKAAPAPAVGTE